MDVESAKGGFDGGTEARDAVADGASEEGNPHAGTDRKFRQADCRRAARMQLVVQLRSLFRCDLIEVFCSHLTQDT